MDSNPGYIYSLIMIVEMTNSYTACMLDLMTAFDTFLFVVAP